MSDYYDVELKRARHSDLMTSSAFSAEEFDILGSERLMTFATRANPDVIVYLAARAGVRYSLENPRAYVDINVTGTFNVMEVARVLKVAHLMMASTSSVYGANEAMHFAETDKCDMPPTIYAATKKANEAMAHSYAHIWNLPTTMFRFFTVYRPWGRLDMALFSFTKGIIEGTPIDIYNHGDMARDFTYAEDLVRDMCLLIDVPPERPLNPDDIMQGDSLSAVAPYRIFNIGNSEKVRLGDFIDAIEAQVGIPAVRKLHGTSTR